MIDSGNYSIIVVADGATQGQLLYQTLTAKGYHVEIAETRAEALNITQQTKPSLFVIDMATPLLDGYELCREIKTAYQLDNIPVILLMDLRDALDAIKGLDAGADSFVSKLCPPESLLHRIESLLSDLPELGEQTQTDPVECHYDGQSYLLTLRPKQTLNLLLSTFENGFYKRLELIRAQKELTGVNEELRQLVAALRKSEHRFNVLVQMLPDIVYRLDTEGRFIFVNEAVKLLGYQPGDLIGKHFREIIVPEDFPSVSRDHVLPEYYGKVTGPEAAPKLFDERRTGSRMTRNLQVRLEPSSSKDELDDSEGHASDSGIYVEVNSSGMYDIESENSNKRDPGDYLGTVGTIRDITDRKRAQAALLRSEQQLRMLVQTATAVIILLSPGGAILEWNSEAEAVFGYKKNNIVGKYFLDLFEDDQKGLLKAAAQDALGGRAVRGVETWVLNLEGTTRSVLWNMNSLLDHNSKPTAIIAVGQDVTGWKQAEKEKSRALSEAEILRVVAETAMETIDGMQDSVLITNIQGIITQINQGFRQTLGWGDEAIGQNIAIYVTEGLDDLHNALNYLSPANPHRDNVGCAVITKEGKSVPVLVNCTFVDASEKRPARLILSLRDISILREFEKDLKEKNETLELLYGISLAIAGSSTLEELFNRLGEAVQGLPILNACKATALFTVDQKVMRLVPGPNHSQEFKRVHENMTTGKCFCGEVALTGKIMMGRISDVGPFLSQKCCPSESKTPLILALKVKDKINGVICLSCPSEFEINSRIEKTLHTIAREIGLVMENVRLQETTRSLTITDPLTGIANRRMLEMMLDQALARADRFGQEVSIIMSDIDHFKQYNDTYGHLEGDKALCAVASIFSKVTRKTDLVARYGGEEFVILVPDANLQQATKKAEAIRIMVEKKAPVTISSGVTSYKRDGDTKENLLLRADQALYQAKHSGRNRVCVNDASRDLS
jgi:diguanylate cyclase (GGDEF)-like protein/PAS domain S-box-containing protein